MTFSKRARTLLCGAFLSGMPLLAQATVIVRQVDEVREGWSGSVSAAFEETVATTQKQRYDGSFSVVHKNLTQEWRSFASVAYGEVNDVEDEDEQMLHVRHVQHEAFGDWRWETFAQTEKDAFAELGQRDILGGGVSRWLSRDKSWRVLALLGAMREREDHSSDRAQDRSETRASLSLQGKYSSPYGWTLDGVSYWQPNANGEASDRRVTAELALSFPLSKRLMFTSGYSYRYNGRPFVGVGRENRKLTSGLNFTF
jgi:putative salt-induced outer membrane protein YdiY